MKDLLNRDAEYVWHPFTQHKTAGAPLPVQSAKGSLLHLSDGSTLIDAISSWWTSLFGHGKPEIIEAIQKQANELDHVIYAGCTHSPAVDTAEKLIELSNFENGKVFTNQDWCNDASEQRNSYGFAKAQAEKIIRKWAEGRNVRLVTIHPSIVFGPILHKRHLEGSMSYLKHFIKGPPFVLDVHINFVDVRDVAIAHVNALEMGEDRERYIIHKKGLWMSEIGQLLSSNLPKKYATKKLPRMLAYVLAIFHPKLSVKQLKNSIGIHVGYDVGDSFSALDLPDYEVVTTLVDSVNSVKAQD